MSTVSGILLICGGIIPPPLGGVRRRGGGWGRTKAMDSVTEVPGVNCLQTAKNCSGEPENPRPDSWDFK